MRRFFGTFGMLICQDLMKVHGGKIISVVLSFLKNANLPGL